MKLYFFIKVQHTGDSDLGQAVKYIFSSNFKYKIPDTQFLNGRKEKGTFPWYFFQK